MICDRCNGAGLVFGAEDLPVSCPECQGIPVTHCCDGLQAQPEFPQHDPWVDLGGEG